MDAFAQSDLLAVELDIDSVEQKTLRRMLDRHGSLASGESLRQLMSTEDWQRLEQVCADLGLDAEGFLSRKPWLVAVQLASMQIRSNHYSESLGIDRHFLQRARGRKQIVELESLEQQLSLFGEFNAAEQQLFLQRTLDEYDQGAAYLNELVEAWGGADQVALERLVLEPFADNAEAETIFQRVFVERNLRMTEAIEALLAQGQAVFVVVGIGHMLGDRGILAELERRGYRVSRH